MPKKFKGSKHSDFDDELHWRGIQNPRTGKEFEVAQEIAERNFICTRDHTYYDPKTKKYYPRC